MENTLPRLMLFPGTWRDPLNSVLDSSPGIVDNNIVKNCCVISLVKPVGYDPKTIKDVLRKVQEFPELEGIGILLEQSVLEKENINETDLFSGVKEKFSPHIISKPFWTVESLVTTLAEYGEGYRDLFFIAGDCPLLDPTLSTGMHEKHRKYFVQYTFADGYPYGLTPEIIKTEVLPALKILAKDNTDPLSRDVLFKVFQKDINSFDIETEISPKDLRYLRISLTRDTKLNSQQTDAIIEVGGRDAESILRLFPERQDLLRTLPAYYQFQLTGGCPQTCNYCPYPSFGGDILNRKDQMPSARVEEILKHISSFSKEAVIGFGLWGEPAYHGEINQLVDKVLINPDFSLCIETSGVGWSPEKREGFKKTVDSKENWVDRLIIIISLDALEKGTYEKIRGQGFEEAYDTAEYFLSHFPRNTYVQTVRMRENEEEVEQFYKFWKGKTENVIVQKYDHFCTYLPQRKVTDLSPLKRYPCWHMKRDFCILLDGTVPLCREDLRQNYVLGNVFEEDIAKIWERGGEFYLKHIEQSYPDLCDSCDEYYTYNF